MVTNAILGLLIFLSILDMIQKLRSLPEGIKDGRRFYELAKAISKEKPIIIWKGGVTETGARAAMAHTGSMAGSHQVWEAIFKQSGMINIISFKETVDCILAFSWLPQPQANRVTILSSMGGTNIGTTDNCIKVSLVVAKLSGDTYQGLA